MIRQTVFSVTSSARWDIMGHYGTDDGVVSLRISTYSFLEQQH